MSRTEGQLTASEILRVEELGIVANNSVIYKNNSGVYSAISLGASSTVLKSNGPTSAPTFSAVSVATLSDVPAPTADYSFGNHKLTGLANGTVSTDAVNYGQLQSSIGGLLPQNPVATPNVIRDDLSAQPGTTVVGEAYLVGPTATGASWTGKEGHIMQAIDTTGTVWIDILGRAVVIGDRLGLALEHGTVAGGFTGKSGNLAQITNATPGSYAYTFTAPLNTYTVTINGVNSPDIGHAYYYNSTSVAWIEFVVGAANVAGNGIVLTGNTISIDTNVTVDKTTIQTLANKTLLGIQLPTTTKTTNYPVTTSDYTIRTDTTAGNVTITLPTAVGSTQVFVIKKIVAANSVIVATTASQTIDGTTTITLNAQYSSIMVQANGTGWDIL